MLEEILTGGVYLPGGLISSEYFSALKGAEPLKLVP